ncbi:MAG TPA: hypothetical protein VF557_09935 [Jatrophihabitans sp.]|uniref:hypothetical protein n=1 Tax=Jatrophihabitans sp. TaxID=1932789 RepID=UPI002EF6E84C
MTDPSTPSPDDVAVLDLVLEALLPYAGAAEVTLVWGDRAGMWFTQVRPRNSRAANLDIAVEENTINITVGRTWFEVFGDVQKSLPYLRDVVDAVFAGAVEESGWKENAFARIRTKDGLVQAGAVHLPLPWRLRRVRRYESY